MAGDQRRFQTAMLHGDRFFDQGRWLDAMKAYRFALAEFPNNAAAIIGFGKAALASDQLDLSRKAFLQALKINPTNLEALQIMGDVQERTGQLDAAAETYLRMGNVYASRSDLDTAIDFWLRATRLASGHTGAHRKLADALAQQGKNRLAAREFLILASIYQRQNETDQMQRSISLAQELLPNDPGVLAATAAVERGDRIKPAEISDAPPEPAVADDFYPDFVEEDPFGLDELFAADKDQPQRPAGGLVEAAGKRALEQLANLIFEDSDNPNVMVIMQAVDAESRDDRIDAINLYRQAAESEAGLPALYFNLGLLYREQGQLSEAADYLEMAVSDEYFMPSAHFALGETYYATNDSAQAVKHFVDALAAIDMQTVSGHRFYELAQKYEGYADQFLGQSNPEQIRQFVFSLQTFFASPDWEKRVYEARMRMNSLSDDENTMSLAEYLETPETEVTVTTLANTTEYLRQNLYMSASEECLRAIQKVPSFLPLHARLAEVLLKQNRTEDAITKYLYIARVYQMRGQADQAVNTLQRILKLAPMDVTVRANLIDLYVASNGFERALDEYLVLADSYYQLAQVDRSLEKYQEAIRLAEKVEEGQPWKEHALLRMADIYNQRFDWSRSAAAIEQLCKLKPDDTSLMRQLIELYFKQGKDSKGLQLLDQLLANYQRQNPAASLELLQELVASFSSDMQLRQRLAVAYVQNNMTDKAIAEYDTLGEMQLEHGLREQAIQTVQAIINLGPEDVEGYQRLLAQISGGAY